MRGKKDPVEWWTHLERTTADLLETLALGRGDKACSAHGSKMAAKTRKRRPLFLFILSYFDDARFVKSFFTAEPTT